MQDEGEWCVLVGDLVGWDCVCCGDGDEDVEDCADCE